MRKQCVPGILSPLPSERLGTRLRLLVRGKRYSAIPVMSLDGIHDVYVTEGTVNGEKFADFVQNCLLPVLKPFNYLNSHSVVIMDNASIHHVQDVV